jgi:hypothetical protein
MFGWFKKIWDFLNEDTPYLGKNTDRPIGPRPIPPPMPPRHIIKEKITITRDPNYSPGEKCHILFEREK